MISAIWRPLLVTSTVHHICPLLLKEYTDHPITTAWQHLNHNNQNGAPSTVKTIAGRQLTIFSLVLSTARLITPYLPPSYVSPVEAFFRSSLLILCNQWHSKGLSRFKIRSSRLHEISAEKEEHDKRDNWVIIKVLFHFSLLLLRQHLSELNVGGCKCELEMCMWS